MGLLTVNCDSNNKKSNQIVHTFVCHTHTHTYFKDQMNVITTVYFFVLYVLFTLFFQFRIPIAMLEHLGRFALVLDSTIDNISSSYISTSDFGSVTFHCTSTLSYCRYLIYSIPFHSVAFLYSLFHLISIRYSPFNSYSNPLSTNLYYFIPFHTTSLSLSFTQCHSISFPSLSFYSMYFCSIPYQFIPFHSILFHFV